MAAGRCSTRCLRHSPSAHGACCLVERWAWKENVSNAAWQIQKIPGEQRGGMLLLQFPQEFWYKAEMVRSEGHVPSLIMLRDE